MLAEVDIVNPTLNETVEFLTAMVTPALLISATGSLVLSTSSRLGRVVDRVRWLEDRLSSLIYADPTEKDNVPLYERRVEVIVDLLDKVTSRSRILQRALAAQYYGLGFFILCSVTIAVAAVLTRYRSVPVTVDLVPIPVGVVGILFLLYAALLMLRETRMATATVNAEMDFTWELARTVAPDHVANKYRNRGRFAGMAVARLKDNHVSEVSDTSEDR
jgi:hypothetical protein